MRLEILIPHWNRAAKLRRLLLALADQSVPAPVCVVDNASTDGTDEMVAASFPDVRYLRLERNYGFGAAVNRAAASSNAELLILLNNDAVPEATFVERIVAAQRQSGAEMVAGCLLRPDGRVDSLGVELDSALNAYDYAHGCGPHALPGGMPLAPTGGAAAYVRTAFDAVAGFDEGFFAYLEDVDLGIRMRLAGMRCAIAADAVAVHEHAGTLGRGSAAKNFLLGESRGYLLWKYACNLTAAQRVEGLIADLVVYAGQGMIDRNIGSVRGRLANRRRVRGRARPGRDPRWGRVDAVELSLAEGLERRLRRRMPLP